VAQLPGCTHTGVECTIMVVVMPCKEDIDEAGNRDESYLDKAKDAKNEKTSFLPIAARSSHGEQPIKMGEESER
jgi:hypothetical protein